MECLWPHSDSDGPRSADGPRSTYPPTVPATVSRHGLPFGVWGDWSRPPPPALSLWQSQARGGDGITCDETVTGKKRKGLRQDSETTL